MDRWGGRFWAVNALLLAASAPQTSPQVMVAMPFELRVPIAPTPFHSEGKLHLVYELQLTNLDGPGRDFKLTRLEVLDSKRGAVVASYGPTELEGIVERNGSPSVRDKLNIGGGMRAVIYLWLAFDRPALVPSMLQHRVTFLFPDGKRERAAQDLAIPVRDQKPPSIGSPLRGEGWLAADGPSNSGGHRRSLAVRNGRASIAQRFAIDFAKFGSDGRHYSGDPKQNSSWYAYGAEVLAVADGTVTALQDGISENVPQSLPANITAETLAGNRVVLDIGKGNYAVYAHLQPNQMRVKADDRVRRGQVLGRVGNSGNSDAPHLHFHVLGNNSDLDGEGLPYEFDVFVIQGYAESPGPKGESEVTFTADPAKIRRRTQELPLRNSVLSFH